jgi:hypothetical protein
MKSLLPVIAAAVFVGEAFAQAPDTLWTKRYGGGSYDCAYSVCQTTDGGFVLVGITESFGAGDEDVWLLRTDVNGDTLWTKTYGERYSDAGYSVQQTTDGGFVITGEKYTVGRGTDIWLVKTDSQGDTIWTRIFGSVEHTNVGHSVQQTTDGGYAITGTMFWGEPRVFLLKTDSNGNMLWIKSYETEHTGHVECQDRGHSLRHTSDGGFVIVGNIGEGGETDSDIWLIRTDADGDTLWTRRWGGGCTDQGWSVQEAPDGGFLVAGTFCFDAWLIRTDSEGKTLWEKTYGVGERFNVAYSIQVTPDGGCVLAGVRHGGFFFPPDDGDVWLIRTDALGDTVWTKTIGGPQGDGSHSIRQTSDGGYIVAGGTKSFGAKEHDVYLIRIAPEVATSAGVNEFTIGRSYRLYQNRPNPFNPSTTIEIALPHAGYVTLKVFNVLGEEVASLIEGDHTAGTFKATWEASGLPSGVYFYRLTAGEYVQTKKAVLMK